MAREPQSRKAPYYDTDFLVSRLESAKKLDADGKPTFKSDVFEDVAAVLHSCWEFSQRIPPIETRDLLARAIFEVGRKGVISKEALLRQVNRNEQAYLRIGPKPYVVATSLSIKFREDLKPVAEGGCRFIFSRDWPKTYDRKPAVRNLRFRGLSDSPRDFARVRVRLSARSERDAYSQALGMLDFIRGIWNFLINRSVYLRRSSGDLPVNNIRLGPIHTLHYPGGKLVSDGFWHEPPWGHTSRAFQPGQRWVKVRADERFVRNIVRRSGLAGFLRNGFVKYARALDDRDHQVSFLRLWTVLEYLVGPRAIDYKQLVRRTSALFADHRYARQILDHLRLVRNQTVHAGPERRDYEAYIFQLKRFADAALEYFLSVDRWCDSENEAREFLDLPTDVDSLRKGIQVRRRAMRFRRS